MSVLKITKENFQKEVIESAQPVLIDFWADWCGPCQMLSPVIDEIASERSDIKVGKINIDEELDLARSFRIMSIPSLVVFENGAAVNKSRGVVSKEEILSLLP
ncbi:MAG: thioredoxin [Lachnospiraceae bacterium]|nr:thioredoxin [Lachnospiraceae bacterium]